MGFIHYQNMFTLLGYGLAFTWKLTLVGYGLAFTWKLTLLGYGLVFIWNTVVFQHIDEITNYMILYLEWCKMEVICTNYIG
jgi:hypothetical protein